MPITAKGLGTSTQALYKMNNVQQLDYVHRYFLPVKGRIKGFEDLYLYAFYPFAVGKPDNYIIGSEKSMDFAREIVKENPLTKNETLSVADFKESLYRRIPKDALELLKKK
jgi:hypothetical protein